ncbi:HNH endonuclease [Cupriavidus sp. UYPR2.512]|uniref:HNH endonuclease n=1 Tax=Cupriavidus sp. UYPR2.512 TaxID=1080187 RepID=UPI00351036D0
MAKWCGYLLTRTEVVHHVDHDPLNNARSNLELWPDNRSHKLAEHGRFVEGAVCRWFPRDLAPR